MIKVRHISSLLSLLFIAAPALAEHHARTSASGQLKHTLEQVKAKDDVYNAVIAISPTAEQEATALDNGELGLLGGMSIMVKDNIDLIGLPNTAGSLALIENYPVEDAPLVAQIKQAGGLVMGKTNLSEWANFRSEKSSSGWSAVGGQTGNAHSPERTPCGSSAGSGVAVALGYVSVAIGTETSGSIICPATTNGVVGIKPTHGIVSGDGIVPLATSQDTAGPIADTVSNAALVLSTMVQSNAENHTALVTGLRDLDGGKSLKGMRLGVLASTLGFDERRDELFNKAVAKLEKAGVTIIDDINISLYDDFGSESYQLLQYEFRRDLNTYLASLPNSKLNTLTLEKLIEFNKLNAATEMKHFDQSIFIKSQNIELSEKEYQAIFKRLKKATREDGLDKMFKQHNLDAIIGISGGPGWLIDHINGDSFFGPSMSGLPAISGNPHITVPGGKIVGMPMGISFVGKRHEDHVLAQLAHKFTQLSE